MYKSKCIFTSIDQLYVGDLQTNEYFLNEICRAVLASVLSNFSLSHTYTYIYIYITPDVCFLFQACGNRVAVGKLRLDSWL